MEDPSNNTEFLLRMPMTKAGVRAMDAIGEYLTSSTAPPEIQQLGVRPVSSDLT